MIQPAPASTSGDGPDSNLTLDDLRQRPQEHLRRLRETGKAATLSISGGRVVVQDPQAYQKLLDELDRLETVEILRQRSKGAHRGEGRPVGEFFHELAAKHGINLEP